MSSAVAAETIVVPALAESGVADPLAPENILKSSGRGIFFMRSFMDDVVLERRPGGGMEVRMIKRLVPGG